MSTESKMGAEEKVRAQATSWFQNNLKYILILATLGLGGWGSFEAYGHHQMKQNQHLRQKQQVLARFFTNNKQNLL